MNKLIMVCLVCATLIFGQTNIPKIEHAEPEYNATICECETDNHIKPDIQAEKLEQESPQIKILKDVKLTAYCKEPHAHICNNGDASNTATMIAPTVGRTIAVDPKVIPYGARVTINGKAYIAEDTGGDIKGNRIDILFETHQEALEFGIQYADVVVEV